jgi:pimeloyl-ACP methyl ester carboxylesterase
MPLQNARSNAALPTGSGGNAETTRIVLFPGLGADARILAPQIAAFPSIEVPDWLPPQRVERLEDYARRMAGRIIDDGRPLILGGVSFGGMIALEAARVLRTRAVVLIASCRSCASVPFAYRQLANLLPWIPGWLIQCLRAAAPLAAWRFGPLDAENRRLLTQVLKGTDPAFAQWAAWALARWPGSDEMIAPVYQIHGDRDRILPCRRTCADEIVFGAGHAVNMTHSRDVNAFLRRVIARDAID